MKASVLKWKIIVFIGIIGIIDINFLYSREVLEKSLIEKKQTYYVESKEDLLNHIKLHKKRVSIYGSQLLNFLKNENPEMFSNLSDEIFRKFISLHDNNKFKREYFNMLYLLYAKDIKSFLESEKKISMKFINKLNEQDKKLQLDFLKKHGVSDQDQKYYFMIEKLADQDQKYYFMIEKFADQYDRYSEEVSRFEEFGREYIHPEKYTSKGSNLFDDKIRSKVFMFLDSFREDPLNEAKIKSFSFKAIKKRNQALKPEKPKSSILKPFNAEKCIRFFERLRPNINSIQAN